MLTLFLSTIGWTQDRYVVFFKDKVGTPYSISQPLDFLSQRSLDRREKNGFGVTEEDLPVNPAYVNQLKATGADVYFTSRWMNCAIVQMNATTESTVTGLSSVSSVIQVANGASLSRTSVPYTIQSNPVNPLNTAITTDFQVSMLEVDLAHSAGFSGEGVLIAVLDGGFEGTNEAGVFSALYSEGRVKGVKDFVKNSGNPYLAGSGDHGTMVLSTMTGIFGSNFTGTAPDADYLLLVTEQVETENPVEEYNWVLGAEYADSAGADVINSSLGYGIFWDDGRPDYPASHFDGQTATATKAANLAAERGILVVTSAGNDGPNERTVLSPADSPYSLAIGAVDKNEVKVGFSSVGPTYDERIKPDIAAMGSLCSVVDESGEIFYASGTSFSSPITAGFAACLIEAFPSMTASKIRQLLKLSGNQANNPDNLLGYGIPTYSRFQEAAKLTLHVGDWFSEVEIYPNPFKSEIHIRGSLPAPVSYKLLNLKGQVIEAGILDNSAMFHTISIQRQLMNGMYFLTLESSDFSETVKLLKN